MYFSVRTYGEIVWMGPDVYSNRFIRWNPTYITGHYQYSNGYSIYTVDLSSYSGKLTVGNNYSEFGFTSDCTWTDIETNFSNTNKFINGMFEYCSTLRTANLFACTSVGSYTFYCCSLLSSVNLPVCTTINSYAFAGCSSLASINLTVCTYISSAAFEACSSLSAITLGASTVVGLYYYNPQYPSRASNIFALTGLTSSRGSIYVPSSLVDRYKRDACWSYFSARIFPIPE